MRDTCPTAASRSPHRWRSGAAVGAAAAAWLGVVAVGFAAWDAYDTTPGPRVAGADAAHGAAGPPWTLTLYAHPHCPCTRASLDGLAELAHALPEGTQVRVVFVRPAGAADGWERSATWDAAAEIPGVELRCDAGGVEAAQLGATTSGHAVLTDAAGRVAFRGGLTRGRGRVGESAGRRAILDIVAGGMADGEAPVFGCPLAD